MSRIMKQAANSHRGARKKGAEARKAGVRNVVGVAGRPLKLSRAQEKQRHAVRKRPSLHERLSARIKRETKRLEPPRNTPPSALLAGAIHQLRQIVLPNDPRDAERREQSGEPIVAVVGAVDLVLLLVVVVLLVAGTVMVYSASLAFASQYLNSTSYYLLRQSEWLMVGAVGMYIAMRMDYRRWRYLAGPGLVISAAGLLLLHTHLGYSINGSTRTLRLSSFLQVEPSEIAKIGLILYAAHWFAGQRDELRHSLRGLIPFGVVIALVIALVFKEPDLGTTAVIAVALLMVYFVAGARVWHLALLAVVAVIGAKLYLHHVPYYQRVRWEAFLNPWADPQGNGYHYIQLLTALGSGGTTGVGMGQSQAKYTMPEPQTDSIFAILGEEWGFLGTMGIMALFLLFAWRGLRASRLAPDSFGRLLAAGLTSSIVFQGLLNMAVVAKLVPFTGVPLPFISYGGSSLSISMVAAGILLNISKQGSESREERESASTYLWWRNRRPYLPVAGRRAAPGEPAIAGHRASAVGARRATGR